MTSITLDLKNSTISNHLIVNVVSKLTNSELINIIEIDVNMREIIEQHMPLLVQYYISQRPYEKVMWDLYPILTLEQFKKNIMVQNFMNSFVLENVLYKLNTDNYYIKTYGINMNNKRKLLYGIIYQNDLYYSNYPRNIENIITEFDDLTEDEIKCYCQIMTIDKRLGNIQNCEATAKYIYKNNLLGQFIEYLNEMLTLNARPEDIMDFFAVSQIKKDLFLIYCRLGIWSEHAGSFADAEAVLTESQLNIYFALVTRVDTQVLFTCISDTRIRDLETDPLTEEEQKRLQIDFQNYHKDRM